MEITMTPVPQPMTIHEHLEAFKAAVVNRWTFADPVAHVAAAEAAFKTAVADHFFALALRVEALELHVDALLSHPAVAIPPIEAPPPAGDPSQEPAA